MRFGVNRDVLGSKFWLEAQAMIIAIASLASYLLVIGAKGWKMKLFCGFMFLMLVLFLSFTVTKSSILGFLAGFLILNVCLFRKFSLRMRYGLIAGLLVCVCGFSLLTVWPCTRREFRRLRLRFKVFGMVNTGVQRLFPGLLLFGRAFAIWMNSRHGD